MKRFETSRLLVLLFSDPRWAPWRAAAPLPTRPRPWPPSPPRHPPRRPKVPRARSSTFRFKAIGSGPYAAGGTGYFGGFIDYMQLVNARNGGVSGVKLTWSECETEYVVERGVECYERLKKGFNGAPAAATNPLERWNCVPDD